MKQERTRFALHIYHLFTNPFMIYSLRYLSAPFITVVILALPTQY